MSTAVLCICIALLVPAIDQLTKYLIYTLMEVGDSIAVIPGFFNLTFILNDGAAFGRMDGKFRWIFMIVTPIFLVLIAVYLIKNLKSIDKFSAASLALIFGGGFSNMIDRIFFTGFTDPPTKIFDGRVVDFLDFNVTLFGRRVWDAVFNVADACVVVGVFLFLIVYIVDAVKNRRGRKRAPAAPMGENLKTEIYTPGARHSDNEAAQTGSETASENSEPCAAAAENAEKAEDAAENAPESAGCAPDAPDGARESGEST